MCEDWDDWPDDPDEWGDGSVPILTDGEGIRTLRATFEGVAPDAPPVLVMADMPGAAWPPYCYWIVSGGYRIYEHTDNGYYRLAHEVALVETP